MSLIFFKSTSNNKNILNEVAVNLLCMLDHSEITSFQNFSSQVTQKPDTSTSMCNLQRNLPIAADVKEKKYRSLTITSACPIQANLK